MNAAARALAPQAALVPPLVVLQVRAEVRARLWFEWMMEMQEAVDALQDYAERNGLVAELGQDRVQAIIAAPFKRLRAIAAAQEAKIVQVIADHEAAAEQAALPSHERGYRTAKSTVDAFWHVAREGDSDRLAAWLADHPRDRDHLHKIWIEKCATPNR